MSDHITLVGNIVGELEERTNRGGGVIAAFRLAVGERRFDREKNEWVDAHTNFYGVSVFGELGVHALRSLRKGQRVILSGRLRLREWETETKRGVSADVVADAIGHDLRWGVSSFERADRASAPAAPAAADGGGSPGTSATDSEGWSLPGASLEALGAERNGGEAGPEPVEAGGRLAGEIADEQVAEVTPF